MSALGSQDQNEYSGTEEDEALNLLESTLEVSSPQTTTLPLHTFNLLFAERNNTNLWNQFENTLNSSAFPVAPSLPPEESSNDSDTKDFEMNSNIFGYDFQKVLEDANQVGKLVFLQFCDYHPNEYATRGLMPIHAIRICDSNRFMVLLNGENKFWLFEKYQQPHHDPKCDYYHASGDVIINIEFSLFLKPLQISHELECIGTGIMRHQEFTKGFRFVASPKKISFMLDYSLANQHFDS